MLSLPSLLAVAVAFLTYVTHVQAKAVFAHFIVSFMPRVHVLTIVPS